MNTKQWMFRRRLWRFELWVRLLRHRYATAPDRLVLQVHVVYDRAGKYR